MWFILFFLYFLTFQILSALFFGLAFQSFKKKSLVRRILDWLVGLYIEFVGG